MTTNQLREHFADVLFQGRAYIHLTDSEKVTIDTTLAAVKDHVEHVIGEDELVKSDTFIDKTLNALSPNIKMLERNQLRAIQRNRGGVY